MPIVVDQSPKEVTGEGDGDANNGIVEKVNQRDC